MFAAIVFVVMATALGWAGLLEGKLLDTDAWTWTYRATDLRLRWDWFDPSLPRVHPPEGHVQHWSRPFDVLLLIGGLLGEPFVGFTRAVRYWGMVLPVLLGLGTLWTFHRFVPHRLDAVGTDALAFAVALQPSLVLGFAAARPDHQALVALLLVVEFALAMRAFAPGGTHRQALWAGAVAAAGLWVGMEFLLPIGGIVIAVGGHWAWRGGGAIMQLARFGVAFSGSATLALLIEHGPRSLQATQLDELSWVYVLAGLMLAMGCGVTSALIGRVHGAGWWMRAGTLGVMGIAAAAVLLAIEPGLVRGPLGQVDPLYARTRLTHISELQPTLHLDDLLATLVDLPQVVSLVPLAAIGLVTLRRQGVSLSDRGLHLLLVPGFAYFLLALRQARWALPLTLCLVVPAAHGLATIMRKVGRNETATTLPMLAVGTTAAMWWAFVQVPAVALAPAANPGTCDLDPMVAAMSHEPAKTIMAPTDWGPEILVRTPHAVLSMPNHRHQPGYTAMWHAYSTADTNELRRMLDVHDVDLVAVCSELATDQYDVGSEGDGMYGRLAGGDVPNWLRERELPSTSGARVRLYEVER